jgi:uncharacterized membrane protein
MDSASALPVQRSIAGLRLRLTPVTLALALMLLALGVRLVGLSMRPLWLDEAYSAWFSSRSLHELWTVVPTYETHPPFYYSILTLWRDTFGGSAASLRSLSVLFAVLTIPVVIAAAFELERQAPSGRAMLRAGVTAFLAACSPMLLVLGQEARPYPLLIFAYALASLGLLRLFREFQTGPGRWPSWLLLAAGTELSLWAHALGVLYAACLALALVPTLLARPLSPPRIARAIATGACIAILYLPCLLMILGRTGDWGHGWLSWHWTMLLQLIALYSIPIEALTIGSALAALVMLLLVKRSLQSGFAAAGWDADRALLLLWWGPALFAVGISALFMPIFLPRTLAATLVPAYLALAGAVARVESDRERFLLSAILVITLLPTAAQVALRPATEPWDQVRTYLERNVEPGDQIWFYPNDSALPMREAGLPMLDTRGIPGDYPATGFKGPIRAGSPAVVSLTRKQAEQFVHSPNARHRRTIWLVTRQSGVFDPAGDLPRALASVRLPGKAREWGYIAVRPYYAAPSR